MALRHERFVERLIEAQLAVGSSVHGAVMTVG